MTIQEYNRLYDIVRAMKNCETFLIYPDKIIGTDKEYITLSEVICDTRVTRFYEMEKSALKLILDRCKELGIESNTDPEQYIDTYSIKRIWNNELEFKRDYVYNIISSKLVPEYRIADLKADNNFNEIMNKKSGDGASLYRINRKYILTLFTGLLPINKSDKASLDLYDIDDRSYLARFTICKGKFTVYKYIVYLYIQ